MQTRIDSIAAAHPVIGGPANNRSTLEGSNTYKAAC